jgi:hypothetical protein
MKLNHLPKAREESQKFIKNDNKHFIELKVILTGSEISQNKSLMNSEVKN